MERQLVNKIAIIINSEIFKFFGAIDFYKKNNVHQKELLENLGLLVLKSHLPIQFVKVPLVVNELMFSCNQHMFI
jgi:hypothetical protein